MIIRNSTGDLEDGQNTRKRERKITIFWLYFLTDNCVSSLPHVCLLTFFRSAYKYCVISNVYNKNIITIHNSTRDRKRKKDNYLVFIKR